MFIIFPDNKSKKLGGYNYKEESNDPSFHYSEMSFSLHTFLHMLNKNMLYLIFHKYFIETFFITMKAVQEQNKLRKLMTSHRLPEGQG